MSGSSGEPPPIPPITIHGPSMPSSSSKTTPPPSDPAAVLQSTPVALSRVYSSLHFERDNDMRQLSAEMAGKFVGPMPVCQFLDELLPTPPASLPWSSASKAAFKVVTRSNTESDMYIPLIDALRPFCPTLELVDTHDEPHPAARGLKPDIAAYPVACGRTRITDFSMLEIHLELKLSQGDDAFNDWKPGDEHSFERDSELGKDTQGQITLYATAQLALQFRTFVFSVFICGRGDKSRARLLRWDRSGAVVSQAFPLSDNHLAPFFWQYHHASPQARGVDVSVSLPSKEEASKARTSLGLSQDATLVQITTTDTDHDGTTAAYITPRPSFESPLYPTGRSTRGFVAYDTTKEIVVYLKDAWRLDVEGMNKEGEIYQILHQHRIPNIAPCIMSGDVLDHRTRSQEFLSEPWACNIDREQLVAHAHYRLVLGTVGAALNSFTSTQELVTVVRDAFEAHKLAWEKAEILHRDISVGNILIVDGGHGLLIDWDLCKHKSDLGEAARRGERVGTWQFMSAKLLLARKGEMMQHTLQDDMESFVHVLGWIALRLIRHDINSAELGQKLADIFDRAFVDEIGETQGGLIKRLALIVGSIPGLVAPGSPCFRTLLEKLTSMCSVRYVGTPPAKDIENYHSAVKTNRTMDIENVEAKFKYFQAVIHARNTKRMQNSDWMLQVMNDAVADCRADQWPTSDGAVKQIVSPASVNASKRKRKRTEELEDEHMPVQKPRHDNEVATERSLG